MIRFRCVFAFGHRVSLLYFATLGLFIGAYLITLFAFEHLRISLLPAGLLKLLRIRIGHNVNILIVEVLSNLIIYFHIRIIQSN